MANRKRSATRYWVEKNGRLYARFQYIDESGKRREKYKPIDDKRKARTAVEEMRREVNDHGSITLHSDRLTFRELVGKYEETELVEAVYLDGKKVSGKRSIAPVK